VLVVTGWDWFLLTEERNCSQNLEHVSIFPAKVYSFIVGNLIS